MNYPCTVPYPWALLLFSWGVAIGSMVMTVRTHLAYRRSLELLEAKNKPVVEDKEGLH